MRRTARTLAIAASVLVLAACASTRGLHPSGHEIAPDSLQARQSLAGAQVSPAAWPQQDWWRALGDAQLDALIAEALHDNPGLAVADARAQLAQSEAQALDAAREPSVDASYAATGARLSEKEVGLVLPEAVGTFAWMQSAGVNFSWNLDLWGGQRAAWEAALGRSRAAEVDRRAARIQLSANVALAYIQLRQAFVLRDIAQRDVERADRIAALTHTLVASGLGLPDNLLQARAEAGIAHQHLAAADAAIDSARISPPCCWARGLIVACRSCRRPRPSRCRWRFHPTSRPICWGAVPTSSPRAGAWKPPRTTSRRPRRSSCPTSTSARWPVSSRWATTCRCSSCPRAPTAWAPRCRCRCSTASACAPASVRAMRCTTRRWPATTRRWCAR
jgi:hypothetical protein